MRIDLPTLRAYRDVVASCRTNIDNALPKGSMLIGDDPEPAALRPAALKWRVTKTTLDGIDAEFIDLADRLHAIMTDSTRTQEWYSAASAKAIESSGARIAAAQSTIKDNTSKILDIARRAALPQRPGTQDAAQEARIAGIKSDVQLLLSNTTKTHDIVNLLGEQLSEALASGDKLTVWVLAGSGWVNGPLFKSKQQTEGPPEAAYRWDEKVATLLTTGEGDDLNRCIRALRLLNAPQCGIPALLVVTGGFLTSVLHDVEKWDPLLRWGR